MKLFVMGATGYIGSVVAEYLKRDGHSLVGLARSEEAAQQLRAAGIEPVMGELGNMELIGEQCRRADGVVQVTTGGFMLEALSTVRSVVDTATAVIEATRGTNKPVIFTYGIAAWLDTSWYDLNRVVTEADPISWGYFYNHLGKVQAMYEAEPGVRHIGIFPGGVYGRGGSYIGGIARAFDCIRKHGKMYIVKPADNAASHVHVDDLAELYALALRSPDTRGLFIASSQIVKMLDIATAVSGAAGLGGETIAVDSGEMRELCGRYVEVDYFINLRGSGEKAMKVLGWKPHHPTVMDDLAMLPKPLDINSVYPSPSRLKAKMSAIAAAKAVLARSK